jgi:hypothetical protein
MLEPPLYGDTKLAGVTLTDIQGGWKIGGFVAEIESADGKTLVEYVARP